MDLEKKSLNYFSRGNFVNEKIVLREKYFLKHMGNTWDELPQDRRNTLLDSLFVEDEVREKYKDWKEHDLNIQESFPRLFINSGQKINVDFENDLWTWRDEHSGPFSWMSRSQQDLTLEDLEPDNISKPQPKQLRKDMDDEAGFQKPESQFSYPSNSWCHDVIEGYKAHEPEILLTPSASSEFSNSKASSEEREEINQAFSSSCDDLSTRSSPEKDVNGDAVPVQPKKGKNGAVAVENSQLEKKSKKKERERGRKSPSPIKILRSGSFKKKSDDQGEEKLIDREDMKAGRDESSAYTNPVMESEWSSFVGDDPGQPQLKRTEIAVDCPKPLDRAPESLTIDRGVGPLPVGSSSPYRGDHIQLIEPDPSPAPSPQVGMARSDPPINVTSPSHSEWSTESTPDHTTHLLKGLQSPQHHAHPPTYVPPVHPGNISHQNAPRQALQETEMEKVEPEEVLTVQMRGDKITVTSQVENKDSKRDSDIPVTGFDFLDNW